MRLSAVLPVPAGLVLGMAAATQPLYLPGGAAPLLGGGLLTGLLLARAGCSARQAGAGAAALVTVATGGSAMLGVTWTTAAPVIVLVLSLTLAVVVPGLVTAAVRSRRDYAEDGWRLARDRERERTDAVRRAVDEERAVMASEIHDALGHRITLLAVRAGRLSLSPGLDGPTRDELRGIRATAADAAAELGATVDLLTRPGGQEEPGIDGSTVEDLVDSARTAGLAVTARVPPGLTDALSDDSRAAVLRIVREGLTNAARHADGPAVDVKVTADEDEVRLRLSNPAAAGGTTGDRRRGHGLVGLRYRAGLLGGSLDTGNEGGRFVLDARVPVRARRDEVPHDLPPSTVERRHHDSDRRRRSAGRAAFRAPLAMVAGAVAVALAAFVAVTVGSVLPSERADLVVVGQSRAEAEEILPPVEMPEPPHDALPEPTGADCRYYEETVSFFRRDAVRRICVADDRVVAVDRLRAP